VNGQAKFCSHCGAALENGMPFCPGCGQRATAGPPPPPSSPSHVATPAPADPADDIDWTVGQAFSVGWSLTKQHIGMLLLLQVSTFLAQIGLSAVTAFMDEDEILLLAAFNIVSFVVSLVLQIGLQRISLDLVDRPEESPSFRAFLSPPFILFSCFVSSILYLAIVLLGSFALIIPGIWLALMFIYCSLSIIDKGHGPIRGLAASKILTRGRRLRLFWFFCCAVGLNILGMIPLGLGLLLTAPITMIGVAWIYRVMEQRNAEELAREGL